MDLPGLYVHVPFCRGKCRYCDFASTSDLALLPDWLTALTREMELYRDFAREFDTLYLGGGTPSLLSESQLDTLFQAFHRLFRLVPGTEITLEANPDDLTRERLRFYRDLGINRLSLGVQSFDDQELAFLGRRHTAAQARRAAGWAREAGFAGLGLDLIYALPGQTAAHWQRSLEAALTFRPEHLSCYQLTVAAGTPLAQEKAAGKWQGASEEEERELFLFTALFLEEAGYLHYEVSNFARGEEHRSRHNQKYWRQAPYLGLGPAAHSFREGRRWWNQQTVEEYCRSLQAGEKPVAGGEILTPEQVRLEALCLGLRTREGVDLETVKRDLQEMRVLEEVVAEGLVELVGNRVRPTREGFLVADHLALRLAG